jgi:hypothetical protein
MRDLKNEYEAEAPRWRDMNSRARRRADTLQLSDVPDSPGVYVWYRDGDPVYVGRAKDAVRLRGRVRVHLKQDRDLSHSAFRRNVCELIGLTPTSVTRARPPRLSADQVRPVNEWIRGCEVAWWPCRNGDEAAAVELALLREFKPPLNRHR